MYKLSNVTMYRPEDIAQRILEHLRRAVNGNLGRDKREVCIITVPAYFEDEQIQVTKKAAQLAGFNCKETLREPVAAALSLGL